MKILLAAVLRIVVLVVLTAGFAQWVTTSTGDDALGAGLLAFLGLVVVALTWSTYDAARRGPGPALVIWLLTSVVGAAGVITALVLADGDQKVVAEIKDSEVFFAILLAGPALIGAGIGGAIHGIRHRGDDDAPQRAAAAG